jgi:hypothetical protein
LPQLIAAETTGFNRQPTKIHSHKDERAFVKLLRYLFFFLAFFLAFFLGAFLLAFFLATFFFFFAFFFAIILSPPFG